jgi:hypothetical protein
MKRILAMILAAGLALPALAQESKPAATPARKTEKKAEAKALPATPPAAKPATGAKRAVEFYGFVKLTAAADTGIDSGNLGRWARSGVHDNQFNMTANETRLGLNFLKEGEKPVVSGKIEFDFMGGGTENKAYPMMRHAYLEIFCPARNVTLLAGQTWDVIAPLNPTSNNNSVYWWVGNIGYRRPQVRLTKTAGKVAIQAAAARTIGDIASSTTVFGSGEDSGFPTVQGRLALSPGKSFTLGIAGHFGEEEVGDLDFVTSSAVADLVVKMGSRVEIRGEAWTGKNLDAYLGGIGTGMNGSKEVHANGGWGALQFGPFGKTRVYAGAGFDNPGDADLAKGLKSHNSAGWAGFSNEIASATTVDLEYTYYDTRYLDSTGGYGHRGQMTFVYSF